MPVPDQEAAMPLTQLNHYFVRANDLEQTKDFSCRVLGFEVMPRPGFPFPGYWLGVNGQIQVHMGPHRAGATAGAPTHALVPSPTHGRGESMAIVG
jgi:catechol 2,3-dioxygenase-like lactoylglutathione lyase family enzyme